MTNPSRLFTSPLVHFFLSLLHLLATLNTASSTPSSLPQKVPARQETTTTTTTDAKASKQLKTRVSEETELSKYTKQLKHQLSRYKLKIEWSHPLNTDMSHTRTNTHPRTYKHTHTYRQTLYTQKHAHTYSFRTFTPTLLMKHSTLAHCCTAIRSQLPFYNTL